jgi:hypothetical protein
MNPSEFPPPRQGGLALHIAISLILAGTTVWGFLNLSRAEVGPDFTLYLLVTLGAFAPLPLFVYRTYALIQANYRLSRDNLTLRWGLRMEDIPLSDIEWIRPASDLTTPLRLPWLYLPGALLGLRRHPDLGVVEFLAARKRDLLLVATAKRVFAISPADASGFVRSFQRSIELGSLTHAEGHSVYPAFVVARAWENPLARYLWLSGILLNLGLIAWVTLLIPRLNQVSLGFSPSGLPLTPVPSVQFMLLPLISSFLFLAGWLAGLSFYRFPRQQVLAVVVWVSSLLSSLLFVMAVYFISTSPA